MINKENIMETLGCDEDFLTELFNKFISESTESLKLLNNALANKEWPLIKGSAHKMLSSTRIFEMDDLTVLLKEIEILAEKKESYDKISSLVESLNAKMYQTFDMIKTL